MKAKWELAAKETELAKRALELEEQKLEIQREWARLKGVVD